MRIKRTVRPTPIPSQKPLGIYINRWLQRSISPNFIKTLNQPEWVDSYAQLYIAVHGDGEIEQEVLKSQDAGHVKILDWRGKTEGGLNCRHAKLVYEHGVQKHFAVGNMDDDVCFKDPIAAMARFEDGFRNHNCGAVGPMHPFRALGHKAAGGPGEGFHSVAKRPWCTDGCQVFLSEFLEEIAPLREWYFSRASFEPNIWMYMVAYAEGWEVCETSVNYAHTGLGGSTKASRDFAGLEWLRRRASQIRNDYSLFRQVLEGKYPQFLVDIAKGEENEINRLRKRYYNLKMSEGRKERLLPRTIEDPIEREVFRCLYLLGNEKGGYDRTDAEDDTDED